ncbi:MAG: hypothetical protein KF705_04250 [Phycisphaeraceae bacterium]|nr:hypothetical protein [Phycisphaeraceae bacterium]
MPQYVADASCFRMGFGSGSTQERQDEEVNSSRSGRWRGLTTTAAASGFTGDYAPANWTFQTNQNGFVQQHDASTLVLVGPDNGSFAFGFSDLFLVVPQGGTISFDWSYSSNDDPGFDAGFYIANSFFFLSDTNGDSGSVSGLTVNVGISSASPSRPRTASSAPAS